jgi:hypothetical protein
MIVNGICKATFKEFPWSLPSNHRNCWVLVRKAAWDNSNRR